MVRGAIPNHACSVEDTKKYDEPIVCSGKFVFITNALTMGFDLLLDIW